MRSRQELWTMDHKQKPSSRCYLNIIESERGWGRKIDEQWFFDSLDEADQVATEFNSHNKAGPAPDWYMQAEGPNKL